MKVYAVFEPRRRDDELMDHADRFRFVRDGFSFWAFVFGPLWMLRHRLWLALVFYLLFTSALAAAAYYRAIPSGAEALVGLMLGLLIGLEAATLRRRKLLWWRWRDAGIVVADDLIAAEQRFFDRWVARAPMSETVAMAPTVIAPVETVVVAPEPPGTPAAAVAATSVAPAPAEAATAPATTAPSASDPAAPQRPYDPDSYVIGMFPPPGEKR
jgi:hypothetical protein